ncbi:FecR domain-containing protein [Sandaracinobacter sp. RS1-74]|nr:FecR domain-containing protein [Sandaracinobacteroides sayramensis]MCG2842789.1 FecR domain-containing protein [Sandaracinobacteroides sayramensis]
MRFAAPSLLLLLAATAPALPNGARLEQRQRAQAEAGDEIIVYRTRAGDSLQSIAAQWFVRPEDWRRVQALNKIQDPADLPAGTALRLRSSWIKTNPITAELAAFRGTVQVVRGHESRPVMKGMELSEGDIVETGPNGFATLVLPDASQVSLPSSSRIRLARLRQVPMSDSIDRRFTLEQGRSEAKVTPMANPASRFLITTPVAVAAVRGTQFRVTYTPSELKAVTEVTEGKVAVGRFQSIEEVLIRANHGAIATSTSLTRAFELLPAPAVDTPERVQNEKAVTFRLKPVPGAARYLVEIATDKDFVDRVGSVEVDGPTAVFEGVENGEFFVRAFAIDALGLVGQPAQYAFERSYAGSLSDAEDKARERKREELASLGDPDPLDYAWFEGDGGTISLVDSGAIAGDVGGGAADIGAGGTPVVPIEDVAQLFEDNYESDNGGYWGIDGGGWNGDAGPGGYSGGGGGGGRPGGGGYSRDQDGGTDPDGNNGGNPGNGPGNGNAPVDNGQPGGQPGNGGNPGNGNPGNGVIPGNNGLPGDENGAGPGDDGQPGNGDGGNPGNGTPGNGDDGNPANPGPGNGGNPGDGGDNGGGEDDDGIIVIPVDPAPPTQPPGDNDDGKGPDEKPVPGGNGNGTVPAAVPEPATWAMMIAGFGLVGWAVRRRRGRLPA